MVERQRRSCERRIISTAIRDNKLLTLGFERAVRSERSLEAGLERSDASVSGSEVDELILAPVDRDANRLDARRVLRARVDQPLNRAGRLGFGEQAARAGDEPVDRRVDAARR